jgi:hypothetical protein
METIELQKPYENMTDEELQNELAKINAILGIDTEKDNDMYTMLCDLADEMIGNGESRLSCEYGIYTGEEIKVTVTIQKISSPSRDENNIADLDEWL